MYHRGEFVTGHLGLRNTHPPRQEGKNDLIWKYFLVVIFVEEGCPPASILPGRMPVEFFHIG